MSANTRLTPNDLVGLPPELLKELCLSKGTLTDHAILEVINALGGEANTNNILIAYYKKHNEVLGRQKLNTRLWRMCKKGLISSVNGKKGFYSLNVKE